MSIAVRSFFILGFFCTLSFLSGQSAWANQTPVESLGETCKNNPELVDEAADRLLVHYYCSYLILAKQAAPAFRRFNINIEPQSVDANGNPVPFWGENELPTACNEYIQQLNDRYSDDPAMSTSASARDFRDTLVPRLQQPRALMKIYFDQLESRRRSDTIGRFFMSLFGLPSNEDEAFSQAAQYSQKIYQHMMNQRPRSNALIKIAKGIKARADIFVSLWTLQSDLSPGCGSSPSITNWGYRNGACYRIKEYTPMFVDFLVSRRDLRQLDASSSVNCDTLFDIYKRYLGEDGLELEYR